MITRKVYGHVARRMRQIQNLSLRQVSASAGISIAHLSEFERGIKEMSSELVSDLCKALKLKQSDFMFLAYREMVEGERREAVRAQAKAN